MLHMSELSFVIYYIYPYIHVLDTVQPHTNTSLPGGYPKSDIINRVHHIHSTLAKQCLRFCLTIYTEVTIPLKSLAVLGYCGQWWEDCFMAILDLQNLIGQVFNSLDKPKIATSNILSINSFTIEFPENIMRY